MKIKVLDRMMVIGEEKKNRKFFDVHKYFIGNKIEMIVNRK